MSPILVAHELERYPRNNNNITLQTDLHYIVPLFSILCVQTPTTRIRSGVNFLLRNATATNCNRKRISLNNNHNLRRSRCKKKSMKKRYNRVMWIVGVFSIIIISIIIINAFDFPMRATFLPLFLPLHLSLSIIHQRNSYWQLILYYHNH